jgi:hypothetical protein
MSQEIDDLVAISFAVAFYQALGYGRNVKTAFDLGCLQIDLENMPDQDSPKLIAINTNPQEIVFISDPIGLENQFHPDASSQHNTKKEPSINIESHAGGVNISGKSTKIDGNVIGGDIHGNVIIEGKKTSKKSWLESTQAKLTMLVTFLGILSTLFILKDQIIKNVSSSRFQTKVVDFQNNVGISGVTVVLSEVDGKSKSDTTKTSSDGSFLVKVNAKPGAKIRLNFTHPDYIPFNEYYETENPKIIKLERKTK